MCCNVQLHRGGLFSSRYSFYVDFMGGGVESSDSCCLSMLAVDTIDVVVFLLQ